MTGQVTLEASVTPGGTVEDIAVLHATATDAAHLESMRQAAREAFARW